MAVGLIVVATVLAYSNTLDASFHFDDTTSIVENRALRDLGSFWPPSGNRYLGYLSLALNYRFGGLDVLGYHVVNLLVHVCNGLLVFALASVTVGSPVLRRSELGPLTRRFLPLAAGLIFSLHPVATQAVTYIVQRFASLATLFFLLSVVLYAHARVALEEERRSSARAAWPYGLSIAAAVAAMRTKEISFTLPIVAAAYELVFFRPGRRSLLLVPLAATAVLVPLGITVEGGGAASFLDDPGRLVSETAAISRWSYLLTQTRVVLTYLRLLVFPIRQNLDYDFPVSRSPADPPVLLAVAVLGSVALLATWALRRARRTRSAAGVLVFFGAVWFFVTLSVESSIIPIRDVIFEHRVYLPSAGAAVALGTMVLFAVERLRLGGSLAAQAALGLLVTAGPLAALTYSRNAVWKNEVSLWSDAVAKSPGKSRPHENLGVALLGAGATGEGIRELLVALSIQPDYPEAHDSLGVAYARAGRLDDAMGEYREAIRLAPRMAQAHRGLAECCAELGRLDEAVREYRESLRLDVAVPKAHAGLGNALRSQGRLDDAATAYRNAIELEPALPEAHNNLAAVHEALRQYDAAIREYREAIRLDPARPEFHFNLGNAFLATRRFDDAVRQYQEAIRLAPGYAEALDNLAATYRAMGSSQ